MVVDVNSIIKVIVGIFVVILQCVMIFVVQVDYVVV